MLYILVEVLKEFFYTNIVQFFSCKDSRRPNVFIVPSNGNTKISEKCVSSLKTQNSTENRCDRQW